MNGIQLLLKNFAAALSRLAASPEEQARYLADLGVAPSLDELGLEFDDLYVPLRPVLGSLSNGPALAAACEALDAALSLDPPMSLGLERVP